MTPIEVGISAVTMLLCTALGGFVYKYFLAKFFYPINSFRLCVLSFAVAIMMTAIFTSGPEKKNLIYLFAVNQLWKIHYH